MTPHQREELRQKVLAEFSRRIPRVAKNHHAWSGWPGTWVFADAAVSVLVEALVPASNPGAVSEDVQRFAIEVEKMLCAKLGREWRPSGMSIESLVNDIASPAASSEPVALIRNASDFPAKHDAALQAALTPQPSAKPAGAEIRTDHAGLNMLISGALYDFAGYLTTRPGVTPFGSTENAAPAADLLKSFAALRGLSLDDPAIASWHVAATSLQPAAHAGLSDAKQDPLIEELHLVLTDPDSILSDGSRRSLDFALHTLRFRIIASSAAVSEPVEAVTRRSAHIAINHVSLYNGPGRLAEATAMLEPHDTAPPAAHAGLTDAEIDKLWWAYQPNDDGPSCVADHRAFARAVLASTPAPVMAVAPEAEVAKRIEELSTFRPVWLQFSATMHRDVRVNDAGWLRRSDVLEALATPPAAQGAPVMAEAPEAEDCDVRHILIDVVPGEDGMGREVYARSNRDVVEMLTVMDQRIEALQSATPPAAQGAPVMAEAVELTDDEIGDAWAADSDANGPACGLQWFMAGARWAEKRLAAATLKGQV